MGIVTRQQLLRSGVVGMFMIMAMGIWILAVSMSERLGEGAFITSLFLKRSLWLFTETYLPTRNDTGWPMAGVVC